jgi:hypothetical protein
LIRELAGGPLSQVHPPIDFGKTFINRRLLRRGGEALVRRFTKPAELKELGREHWKKFRPKHYRSLKKLGYLEEALEKAAPKHSA